MARFKAEGEGVSSRGSCAGGGTVERASAGFGIRARTEEVRAEMDPELTNGGDGTGGGE